jgi:hypothetical protein
MEIGQMSNYSAQGSCTVRRLRNGDTLFLSFDTNGIPLYQGVDPTSGAVTPDWTVAANQPIITPKVASSRNNTVTLSNHTWEYNGVTLLFNSSYGTDGDYIKDSTKKFELNQTTGQLKIVDNLASTINYANDTLAYSCVATVAGLEYNLAKSLDINLQAVGASSYIGFIIPTTTQISKTVTTTILKTQLMLGKDTISSYYTKWYKGVDRTEMTGNAGSKAPTIGRDDVDGTTMFYCDFYAKEGDITPVALAACRITDVSDEYIIVYGITSDNKVVDDGKPVTLTGKIIRMRDNKDVTSDVSNAVWETDCMNHKTWKSTRTAPVASNTITITTADTDTDDEQNDVEVVGEVTFDF